MAPGPRSLDRSAGLPARSACPRACCDSAARCAGLNPDRLIVIPNGIDPGRSTGASAVPRAALGIPGTRPPGSGGRPARPPERASRPAGGRRAGDPRSPDWHLALAGDGPCRGWLLEQIASTAGSGRPGPLARYARRCPGAAQSGRPAGPGLALGGDAERGPGGDGRPAAPSWPRPWRGPRSSSSPARPAGSSRPATRIRSPTPCWKRPVIPPRCQLMGKQGRDPHRTGILARTDRGRLRTALGGDSRLPDSLRLDQCMLYLDQAIGYPLLGDDRCVSVLEIIGYRSVRAWASGSAGEGTGMGDQQITDGIGALVGIERHSCLGSDGVYAGCA